MNEEPPPKQPEPTPAAKFEIIDDKPKTSKKQYAIMSIVCLALSGALLTISLSQKANKGPQTSSEVATLKAQLDDLHEKVRAKRMAMGLKPSINKTQSTQEIAADAQQSIQQLVDSSNALQSLLDQKDIELLQKQQQIEDFNKEIARLKSILQRIQIDK